MATDQWRYLFYAMQNGTPNFTSEVLLFALPMNSVSFTSKLNASGTFTGTCNLADPTVEKLLLGQPTFDLLCGKTAIYVELNGVLVWGGMLQTAKYQASSRQVQLGGVDWWAYFAQRIISWNASYSAQDQLFIASDLINQAQAVVGGNVGVVVPTAGTSGVNLTVSYLATDFKQISGAVNDIATNATGFDWSIDVQYVAGVPTKQFNLWFPRRGRTQQQQQAAGSAVTFVLNGASGQDYIWPADSSLQAITTYGSGAGGAGTGISSTASDPNVLNAGWPLLEDTISRADISQQSLLDAIVKGYQHGMEYPITLPEITYNVGAGSDQSIGTFTVGDDCRLIISPDAYFSAGYDSAVNPGVWWRICQLDVKVADQGLSQAHIVFARPPFIVGGS